MQTERKRREPSRLGSRVAFVGSRLTVGWARLLGLWLGAVACVALPGGVLAGEGYVWVEGEDAASSSAVKHSWYGAVKADELSGGAMLSNWRSGPPAEASYTVRVPESGRYTFWARINPVATKLSYRVDKGPWTAINMQKGKTGQVNIAADGKIDLRFLAWVRVGEMELKKGARTITFRLESQNNNHGMIDCFVLTRVPFAPRGVAKPGQKLGLADAGTWAFEPDADTFDKDALLDLRGLNETTAGQSGWVKRTPDGRDFLLGDGTPVRFWALNTYVQKSDGMEDLRRHARFLAKRGVNMVRFHGHLQPKGKDSKITDVDEAELDRCWRLVAAMKEEGIYTTISPYWAMPTQVPPSWGVEGFTGKGPQGMLFFDETLQRGYKAWLKALLTRSNPYTKTPLGQDPAVAILQLQNEDSMLFWTIQGLKPGPLRRLGKRFGDWCKAKYGSLEKAKAAWDGAAHKNDDLGAGVAGLYIIWHFTQERGGGQAKRMADQLQFYGETMHAFNAEMVRYVRDELKCPVLINPGNWKTADPVKLADVERWSYTAGDVIGANKYYGGVHINPSEGHKSGYLVSQGDRFTGASVTRQPRHLSVNMKQVAGYPTIISEGLWVPPLQYQAEGPFLVAAYSSLTGLDIFYWFSTGEVAWGAPMGKWQLATPATLGQFPAAAYLFRKRLVQQGKPVVVEARRLADLWQRRSPVLAEKATFDPNRDAGDLPKDSTFTTGLDPLAFLVGPVEAVYGGDPRDSKALDLGKYIDPAKKTARSITGQLAMDGSRGLCTLDAPMAQGACGFLKEAGALKLSAMKIESAMDYGSILAVSLDDQPLTSSKRIFIQVGAVTRPHGFRTRPSRFQSKDGKQRFEGEEIVELGGLPWNVAETKATLAFRNGGLSEAVVLDPNFMPVKTLPIQKEGGAPTLPLPPDAMYLLLR